jgi:hypothetical protein
VEAASDALVPAEMAEEAAELIGCGLEAAVRVVEAALRSCSAGRLAGAKSVLAVCRVLAEHEKLNSDGGYLEVRKRSQQDPIN